MKDFGNLFLTKVRDVNFTLMNEWLSYEILSLADDFGQKLEKEQATHISYRMKDILYEKYKNWDIGEIHSIFQLGMSGVYGKYSKVTVQSLVSWLISADKQKRGENVNNVFGFEEQPLTEEDKRRFQESFDRCFPFIKFCEERNIDVSNVDLQEYYELRNFFNENGIRKTETRMENYPKYDPKFTVNNLIRKLM